MESAAPKTVNEEIGFLLRIMGDLGDMLRARLKKKKKLKLKVRNDIGIQSGSNEMGGHVGSNMFAARHSVMALSEAFGTQMPRAITAFIAHIGPMGAILEAAFPFAAIGLAAVMLIEHLGALHAAGVKLTEDQVRFGTAVQNAYNQLDQRIIQAQIKSDELRNDHLGALRHQLELIDKQGMSELVHSFAEVAKEADVVFADLKSHWYTFGIGSTGAKHALDEFQTQYDSLLAKGKDGEAADLLKGMRESAQHVLDLQKQAQSSGGQVDTGSHTRSAASLANSAQWNQLRAAGVGIAEKDIEAQQTLVDALNAQVSIEERVNELKKVDSGNATATTGKEIAGLRAEGARQAAATMAGLQSKAQEAQYREDLQNLEQSERDKIDATEQGSAERLAAIDAALKTEQSKNLQNTSFYRELMTQRVEVQRQADAESSKSEAAAGKEAAANTLKVGELTQAAAKEQQALQNSSRRVTIQEQLSQEIKASNDEYTIKLAALQHEAAALDKGGKDASNKLKELQDKERQLVQQHENEITTIKDKAEMERNAKILSAEQRFNDTIAAGLTQVLMGHKSFASMMDSIGNQVVSGMMENAIKSVLANDYTKEFDDADAARKAYLADMHFPFPVNIIMGPVLGAMAFASVMAFEDGGVVPGVGRGDTVPAMLPPGEGIVPGSMMDSLKKMARSGGMDGGNHYHAHVSPTYHLHVVDTAGMAKLLDKHSDTIQKHVSNQLRKMNR
jgi:hypothetical protein